MLACYRQTTGEDGRVWLGWMLGISCAVRGVPEPIAQTERYLVQISATMEPAGDVPADIEDALGPWTSNLELRLTKEPSRVFRDESIGALIRFEAASLNVIHPDEDPRPVALDLVGRVIEIRTFEDGEILDVGWAGRTAGMGRYLDVFDLVFPAISLAAPRLRDDETALRRIIWPMPVGRTARWDHGVDATWKNTGRVSHGQSLAWSIEYGGPWRLAGRTRAGVPRQRFNGKGQATGSALFGAKGEGLLQHTFQWERLVTVEGAAGRLSQKQSFDGRVERQP